MEEMMVAKSDGTPSADSVAMAVYGFCTHTVLPARRRPWLQEYGYGLLLCRDFMKKHLQSRKKCAIVDTIKI